MKNIIITVVISFALFVGCAWFFYSKISYVTSEQFDEAHKVLNVKIDSIKQQLNNVENSVNYIENNTDTIKTDIQKLQQGQKIIYDEVQTITKRKVNFWDLF